MAFVDHDQVKKIRRKLLVDILLFVAAGDGLVQRQIDFVALVDLALADLGHGRTERLEVVVLGLVDQNVAVGQEQDAFFRAGLPQSPDDLECRVGFSGASGHHQQDALLPLSDRLDRVVDGGGLVYRGVRPVPSS